MNTTNSRLALFVVIISLYSVVIYMFGLQLAINITSTVSLACIIPFFLFLISGSLKEEIRTKVKFFRNEKRVGTLKKYTLGIIAFPLCIFSAPTAFRFSLFEAIEFPAMIIVISIALGSLKRLDKKYGNKEVVLGIIFAVVCSIFFIYTMMCIPEDAHLRRIYAISIIFLGIFVVEVKKEKP